MGERARERKRQGGRGVRESVRGSEKGIVLLEKRDAGKDGCKTLHRRYTLLSL